MELPSPDFFIVGFPKCGTSFLHEKLKNHKNIWMPNFEPVYFCTDMNSNSHYQEAEDYAKIFTKYAKLENVITGEKTSNYASSDVAMEKIYKHNKNAKIIVALRNPVDAIISYHNHNIRMGYETIFNFEEALLAQGRREKENYKIPFYSIKERNRFKYYDIFDYPDKVKRILNLFGKNNIKIVLLDDIIKKPQDTINEILLFLALNPMNIEISKVNETKPLINHGLKEKFFYTIFYTFKYIDNYNSESAFLKNSIVRRILKLILGSCLKFLQHPYDISRKKGKVQIPSNRIYHLLNKKFSSQIDELSILLERDLSSWSNANKVRSSKTIV